MPEPTQKCENVANSCKTILQNCSLLLEWPFLAVLVQGEILIDFVQKKFYNIDCRMRKKPSEYFFNGQDKQRIETNLSSAGVVLQTQMGTTDKAREQCYQIGRFLKVFGNKLAYKSIPKRLESFRAILNRITLCKNC